MGEDEPEFDELRALLVEGRAYDLGESPPGMVEGLVQAAERYGEGPGWPELAALALRHRERVIQRLAHEAVMARPAAVQRAVYASLLADGRRHARRLARAALRALEPAFDAAGWYRDAMLHTRDPVALAAVVQGYGECEEATDDAVLASFDRHAKNRVKAASRLAAAMIAGRRGA